MLQISSCVKKQEYIHAEDRKMREHTGGEDLLLYRIVRDEQTRWSVCTSAKKKKKKKKTEKKEEEKKQLHKKKEKKEEEKKEEEK